MNTCSKEEAKNIEKKILRGFDDESIPKELITAVENKINEQKKNMTGGGKYKPVLIHALAIGIYTGAGIAGIQASMYLIQESGLSTVIQTYMGVSEYALYGCGTNTGVLLRQTLANSISPMIKCSNVVDQIEMINEQILIILNWVNRGIQGTSVAMGTYDALYDAIENYLDNNDPPCPIIDTTKTGGKKKTKRGKNKSKRRKQTQKKKPRHKKTRRKYKK